MQINIHILLYLSHFVLDWGIFQTKSCRENQITYFTFYNFLFRKSCSLWDNVKYYSRVGQTTDDNMTHVHCMLNNWSWRHTLRRRITAKMVAQKRFDVTLYLNCLSCFFFFTVPLLNLHLLYPETHNFALSVKAPKKVQMFWILSRKVLSLFPSRSVFLLKSTILTAIECYPPITLRVLNFTICKMTDGLHS